MQLTLDASGEVLSRATATSPDGAKLTVHPGTTIAILANGNATVPAAGASVVLSITSTAVQVALPAGIAPQLQVKVTLKVNGTEMDAAFWWTTTEPTGTLSTGARDEGAKLVVPVAGTGLTTASLGLLFDVTSGAPRHVATTTIDRTPVASATILRPAAASALVFPPAHREASGASGGSMAANVSGTGTYAAGASTPSAGPATSAGAYWSRFPVPDPGCIGPPGAEVCGPSTVARVEIVEESTAEILGICSFDGATSATTGLLPPGYQFWCALSSDAAGGSVVTVSSEQANLPWIHAYVVRRSDGHPMLETYVAAVDGLHLPGGGATLDPYEQTDLQFAGFKHLVFRSSANHDYAWVKQHALEPLVAAGYQASIRRYTANSPGFEAEVDVADTLDARSLLQRDVVLAEGSWEIAGPTRGNRGTYETSATLKHLDVDEGAGLLTLTGEFGISGCDGVTVLFGAETLTPITCEEGRIIAPVPERGSALVAARIGWATSNALPLTEWRARWHHTKTQVNDGGFEGTLVYGMDFDVAFRADVHDVNLPVGTPGRRARVPFTCERGAQASAYASGTAIRQDVFVTEVVTLSGAGSTTNLIPATALPTTTFDSEYVVCEGYVDLDARQVAWAVNGGVRGVISTVDLTDHLSDPPVHETTVETLTLRAGTWRDPGLPDTILWPQPAGIWAAAWLLPLDSALALPAGAHVSGVYGTTDELRHDASAPSDAP